MTDDLPKGFTVKLIKSPKPKFAHGICTQCGNEHAEDFQPNGPVPILCWDCKMKLGDEIFERFKKAILGIKE